MRRITAQIRIWWRRIPPRARLGVLTGLIAIGGLLWQHQTFLNEPVDRSTQQVTSVDTHIHAERTPNDDGHARGEYQPDPSGLPAPPDYSPQAARTTAQRFAANFASPNGNFDDWLARISPDVSAQLQGQYRLTDIRNVTQATVTTLDGPLDSQPGAAAFRATYNDGSQIEIRLEMGADGWKVVNVLPLAPPGPREPEPR